MPERRCVRKHGRLPRGAERLRTPGRSGVEGGVGPRRPTASCSIARAYPITSVPRGVAARATARPLEARLLGLIAGMFILLAIQNGTGIWTNLFVTVNDTASYSGVYPAMFQSLSGSLHTIVGILIGLNAILLVGFTWRLPDRRLRVIALLVLGLTALAAYSGFHFVQSGGDNTYSAIMEYCFTSIVLLEALALYLVARSPLPSSGQIAGTTSP